MRFADIQGNDDVKRALAGMIDSGRTPHAIMLHEDDGGGAMPLVQAFLSYLFCSGREDGDSCGRCPSCSKISKLIHPDVHYIFPVNSGVSLDYIAAFRNLVTTNPYFHEDELLSALEIEGKSTMIKVEEAKALLDTLSLSALERGYRAVVIYLPEKMNREAANRLLKSIEEPPAKTQFLLITHSPESVLTTIASRCQRIRVMRSSACTQAAADPAIVELFSALASALISRSLPAALESADQIAALPSREKMKSFCEYAASQMRSVFLLQQGLDSLASSCTAEQRDWAAKLSRKFPRASLDAFSRASMLIDRNVSPKILFTDLVDRLYMI